MKGDPLHAQARQLAEHGGDRDRRHGPAVPGPAHPGPRREVEAWQERRNRESVRVDWRFTTADARVKLKSLYPSIQM